MQTWDFLQVLQVFFVAARVGSVNSSTGTSFEMDAIGSCFIGGASAYGGSGTVGGVVVIGALLLGVINMGMSIMGIGDSWQYVVKGAVLLIAVVFDVLSTEERLIDLIQINKRVIVQKQWLLCCFIIIVLQYEKNTKEL